MAKISATSLREGRKAFAENRLFPHIKRKDKEMAKLNIPTKTTHVTHEGAPAKRIDAEQQLRRSLMACLLWEKTFYEEGEDIANRITSAIPLVKPETVYNMAIEAREKMNLRHAPLLVAREMSRLPDHKVFVSSLLERIIQRADELTEFLAIYWKDGRQPLSAQVKKGLAKAFTKFNAYQLAKYNRGGQVKLRDVLFLCHAKAKDEDQQIIWNKLVDGTLEPPDTWEVALSAGKDKKETWERLLSENKLGGLALLRNLRNMKEVGVNEKILFEAFDKMETNRILPYRFIAAAKYAPQWEWKIEQAMLRSLKDYPKIEGKTILLIDVSGSMVWNMSNNSDMNRIDAACGLAILAREICEDIEIFTFSEENIQIPARHGFALRDAIVGSQPHRGTYLGAAVKHIFTIPHDRLIVFTDEQSHDTVPNPKEKGYMINVASYKNGVGYGKWLHIDGFSEAIIRYIQTLESVS
ncbi:MAG: TROVE domain-containing protein [Methanophagales archaeon]|nr:TROVE domain-containing protein [Methanophagales archaeon]